MDEAGKSETNSVTIDGVSLRDFLQRADAKSFIIKTETGSMNDFLDVQLHEEHSVKSEPFLEYSSGEELSELEPATGTSDSQKSWVDSGGGFSVSCGICPFKGKETLSIIEHMKTHRFKTHACCICALVLSSEEELSRHLGSHKREVPHICSYCHHGFFRLSSLQGHKCLKKPKLCQHCSEPYRSKNALKKHIRDNHKMEIPKKRHCPHCDFSCWSGPALNTHLRTHRHNKYLQCPHCTFQFSKVTTLQSHLRIHRDEPSFICPYCGIVFAKYGIVKLHMEIHKDRSVLKCKQCDYETPNAQNLYVHRYRNHRDRNYSCPHCDYSTAYTFATNCTS
uniref:Zinc finger protein 57 n=1 Tax=Lygus hesperus TaxID=30085 RepID=A0A0A9Z6T1_LYGHE